MKLGRVLKKLRGRSAAELLDRARQAASMRAERLGVPPMPRLSEQNFSRVVSRAVVGEGGSAAFRRYIATRTTTFFAGARDHDGATLLRGEAWSSARLRLVNAADRVVEGRFDLLGYKALDYGHPIDWHFDPVSKRRAPRHHWSTIPYLDAAAVGDHKVIWEVNRHQHFMLLGRAWQLTGDARYAQCFAEQVDAWMRENPPKIGINWASSLEVAYRAIAWLWAIELFREAPELTADILSRMVQHLDLHGRHLETYLSTYFSPNTHLTGEALGLLYLGTVMPELAGASRWRTRGWRILEAALPWQVHDDGVYFEQASHYHRYTVDIYLHALMLQRMRGETVPPFMTERVGMAAHHLADLMRADGCIPVIGDDDGGRLVWLEERDPMDVRAALGSAALVCNDPSLARIAGGATEEVVWLHGGAAAERVSQWAASASFPDHTSRLYPSGGYAIMRDGWGASSLQAVVDAGPLGALNCGHAHADALAIEVAVGGCAFFVDAGTFSYTSSPEARDKFRHSASHNTVTINGEASSVPAGAFAWQHKANAKVEQWWSGAMTDWVAAGHSGFERLGIGASHRRNVLFVRGAYWVVIDHVTSDVAAEAVAHYHAALGGIIEPITDRTAEVRVPCRAGWRRLFFGAAGDVEPILWGDDWVSPSYGSRERAPYGRIVSRGMGARELVAVLCPHGEFESVSVHELPAEKGRQVVINRQSTYDQVLLPSGGELRSEGMLLRGTCALVRRASEGSPVQSVALFGADARLEVEGVVITASGAAEAVRGASGWSVTGTGARVDLP